MKTNEPLPAGGELTAQPSVHQGEMTAKRSTSQQKPKRFLFLILFAAGALCFAGIAFYGIRSRAAATEHLQQTTQSSEPAVIVVKPEKAPASISINLPGQTQAYIQASLYAQTTGYVKSWNFDIGSQVRAGDVLAEIDTPEVDQELNQARAQLNNAQSALHLSESTYKRNEDLFHRKVIAAQDFDTAADTYHENQAMVIADDANVKRLEALENFKVVRAPFEGIVTMRNIDIGGLVNAGSGNPLFTVARIKPLRVYVNVPESMSDNVKAGDNAELMFSEIPDRSFAGKVVRTAGAIDPNSRTLLTEVDVPNEDGRLLPGAYMQVHLSTDANIRSLLIPQNTLLFRSEGTTVGVVEADGKVALKKIKIGRDLGTRLEIVQGLSPNDEVIVNPSDSLASGQTVKVEAAQNEKSK